VRSRSDVLFMFAVGRQGSLQLVQKKITVCCLLKNLQNNMKYCLFIFRPFYIVFFFFPEDWRYT